MTDCVGSPRALHIRFKVFDKAIECQRALMKRRALEHIAQLPCAVGRQKVGQVQSAGITGRCDRQDAEHIKTKVGQVCQRFLTERLIVELGANQSEAAQRAGTRTELRKRRR